MTIKNVLLAGALCSVISCSKTLDKKAENVISTTDESELLSKENPADFTEVGSIDLGDAGAAEISTYDAGTKKLFVVNNGATNKIDVVDLSNPALPVYVTSIELAPFGGLVNSVAARSGILAAAIEATDKVSAGKVIIFNTADYTVIKEITVGSLPDMVAISADGAYIVTANEGEPNSYNEAGSVDPVGSVSVITVANDYAVVTLDFASFENQAEALKAKGFRLFGPNASFAQDIEPEYVTISADAATAWVTLQENNAIAKVNLATKTITDIFPLGFKNFNKPRNAFDPSDKDGGFMLGTWNVKGMYEPDGIAVLEENGFPFLFTVNEGDARDYDGFGEELNVADDEYVLDALAFPNAAALKAEAQLGRLTVTSTLGDKDNDGDYDEIYAFGARSFSIWNGFNGSLIYDCGSELEEKTFLNGFYDDTRSDNKGVEPEGIAIGSIGKRKLAFMGMERVDAVAIYDISNPGKPVFSQVLKTGDAPEGVLFVEKKDSPNKRSLLILSSESDGVVKIYAPATL